MRAVRIAAKAPEGSLALELKDIFRVLGERGHPLRWFMHDLEVTGDVTTIWPAGVLELQDRTTAPEGLEMTWNLLCGLAAALEQTVNGVVRGRSAEDDSLLVEIEAFDSTYWTITARDEAFVSELRRTFQDTQEVAPFAK